MNLLVTGGGTGGHIYPALSIAKGYRNFYSDTNLLYVGRKEGLESELLPNEDMDYEAISITYMKKKNFAYFFKYINSIFKAVFQSYKIIKKFKRML